MTGTWQELRALPGVVFRYRGLIRAIVAKELVGRYNGSLLGPLWLIIPPVFMIFIYTVVFGQLMHSRLPGSTDTFGYSVYLCAGLLIWTPFLEAMQRGKNVFIDHANLIKKSAFPRPILFIPVATVAAINFALLALAFLGFLGIARGLPSPLVLAWIPLCAALAACLGLAMGAILAILNVFFRDVGQLADLAAQLLFWATPIVYPVSILPPALRDWMSLNPLFPLVLASQGAALGNGPADGISLLMPLLWAAVGALLAALLFVRARSDLMDQL